MDAKVIPFPHRDVGTDDLTPDEPIEGFTMGVDEVDDPTAGCEDCGVILGDHDDDCPTQEPSVFPEADGRWVWIPADDSFLAPEDEPPVGMVAHQVKTLCKWTYRHIMEEQPIPQPCCYSVLITTKRLPGPVREERSWLAPTEGDAPA